MTIGGNHTVAELRDWIAANDFVVGRIASGWAEIGPAWTAVDPAGAGAFGEQWAALRARYELARAGAEARFLLAKLDLFLPDSLSPAEDQWQAVARALERYPGGPQSPGDLQDLYARIAAARTQLGAPAIDFTGLPQPTPGSDADLNLYQASDAAIRAGEAQLPSSGTSWGLVLAGACGLGLYLAFRR